MGTFSFLVSWCRFSGSTSECQAWQVPLPAEPLITFAQDVSFLTDFFLGWGAFGSVTEMCSYVCKSCYHVHAVTHWPEDSIRSQIFWEYVTDGYESLSGSWRRTVSSLKCSYLFSPILIDFEEFILHTLALESYLPLVHICSHFLFLNLVVHVQIFSLHLCAWGSSE